MQYQLAITLQPVNVTKQRLLLKRRAVRMELNVIVRQLVIQQTVG